jgi:hypothetical protein
MESSQDFRRSVNSLKTRRLLLVEEIPSMNESIVTLAIAAPAVFLAAVLYWLDRVRRRESLFRWASENHFKLLAYRQPFPVEASAFPFSLSKAQQVFRVEVESNDGRHRAGWVRLGSAWLGLSSHKAVVKWIDQPPQT